MTTRTDVINYYLDKIKSPKSYLEIGVGNPENNFNKIVADIKHGVNIPSKDYQYDYNMTSDGFFEFNKNKYDVIFIDGLHTFKQSYSDFVNSEKCLNNNGIIIMHDCCPITEKNQGEVKTRTWTGDVWKTFIKLRSERKDLEMFVIDCDWGVGVIKKGEQELLKMYDDIYDYKVLDCNRTKMLNLISVEDWLKNE